MCGKLFFIRGLACPRLPNKLKLPGEITAPGHFIIITRAGKLSLIIIIYKFGSFERYKKQIRDASSRTKAYGWLGRLRVNQLTFRHLIF